MSDIRYNGWLHRSGTGGVYQDSSGNVGIGSSVPSNAAVAANTNVLNVGVVTATTYYGSGANLTGIDSDKISEGNTEVETVDTGSDGHITFDTDGTEAARFDPSQRLLVGHTANEGMFYTGRIQVQGTNSSTSAITVKSNQNDSGGPAIVLGKSRGAVGGATVVQNADEFGCIYFNGADGTDCVSQGAYIRGSCDGTPGSNDMPGRLTFATTADGAATPTERLRITSDGTFHINSPDLASGGRIYASSSALYLQSGNGRQTIKVSDASAGVNRTIEMTSAGNLAFPSGYGIDFSATADSGATGVGNVSEILDDYEQGDWDPTLPDSDGGIGSVSGWYTKVGQLVSVQFAFVCLTNSDNSGMKIAGFPFTNNGQSVMVINSEANQGSNGLCFKMTNGQAYGSIFNQENDEKTYSNFSNCWVWGSGTYMTNS